MGVQLVGDLQAHVGDEPPVGTAGVREAIAKGVFELRDRRAHGQLLQQGQAGHLVPREPFPKHAREGDGVNDGILGVGGPSARQRVIHDG